MSPFNLLSFYNQASGGQVMKDSVIASMCNNHQYMLLIKKSEEHKDDGWDIKNFEFGDYTDEKDIYGFLIQLYRTYQGTKNVSFSEDITLTYLNDDYSSAKRLIEKIGNRKVNMKIRLENNGQIILIYKMSNSKALCIMSRNADKLELWLKESKDRYMFYRFVPSLYNVLSSFKYYKKADKKDYIRAWLLVDKLLSLQGKEFKLFYAVYIKKLERYFHDLDDLKKTWKKIEEKIEADIYRYYPPTFESEGERYEKRYNNRKKRK